MKKFALLIVKIVGILFIVFVGLDVLYTAVYLQSKDRGKIGYVFNSEARVYDVVILGSSRANNHFVAKMFNDKGLKAFNFGISGSRLFESSLILKLMVERKYEIKNVIVEVDLNIASEGISEGTIAGFLPYIHHSETIKNHFKSLPDYNRLYYIPFYRYIVYDAKIGFRELFFNAIHKKTRHLQNEGYYALDNIGKNMKVDLSKLQPHKNKSYEEIKQICKANKINLIAVMTPMCENVKNINYFKDVNRIYPEIHNYEAVVNEDIYFSSCGHMNNEGAKLFTGIIIKDFFKK